MVFLANRFPKLINILTSTDFVSGTSGITPILKYRSVNPILSTEDPNFLSDICNLGSNQS